jgi:catechol 2,3-dioxygenase-like lactoylglutathione lyase family enzyme
MLSEHRMHATLPTSDLERARRFWGDTLGFTVVHEVPDGALMFESANGSSRFTLFVSMADTRAGHTQAGFAVPNIEAEVAALKAKGVAFEEYDYPSLKTENGIAATPAGRSAWFKDPDGNLIGLVQFG